MTREEAIKRLHKYAKYAYDIWNDGDADAEAFDMAIESLQREIPKNPIVNYIADSDGSRRLNDVYVEDSLMCPVCHTYFGTVYNEGYCRKCGQKLIQKRVRVIEK